MGALNRFLLRHRLLVINFNLKSQIFDHAPDFWGWLAWCCEVAVYEDGVGWIEGEGLKAAEIVFAASGNADFGARVKKTEEAEHFQAALWSQLIAVFQRRACHRMEHIQWNRVRLHLDQGHCQVDEVFVLLSHSDDPT